MCSQLMRCIRGITTIYYLQIDIYTVSRTAHSFAQSWFKTVNATNKSRHYSTLRLHRLHILNEDRRWNLKSDQTATYFQKSNFNRISNHIWISSAFLLRAMTQIRMLLMHRSVCMGCWTCVSLQGVCRDICWVSNKLPVSDTSISTALSSDDTTAHTTEKNLTEIWRTVWNVCDLLPSQWFRMYPWTFLNHHYSKVWGHC